MDSESKKSLTIDFAILVTITSGFSYLLAYLFYAGKFTYYKIPWFLIDISISNIIYTIIVISPFIFIFILDTLRTMQRPKDKQDPNSYTTEDKVLSRKKKKKRKKGNTKYLRLVLLLLITIIIILIDKKTIFGIFLGLITSFLVGLLIKFYKKSNYVYMTILIYFFFSLFTYTLGYILASATTEHIIVKDNNKTFVALTIYKEQFLLAPLDINSKIYSNEYNLIEIKDISNFSQMEIGAIELKR